MASAIYLCQCLGTQVFPIATTTDRPLQDWVAALTPAVVGAGLFVVAFGPLVVDYGANSWFLLRWSLIGC